jgi:molybdenum cofactor biosynthesis protein B
MTSRPVSPSASHAEHERDAAPHRAAAAVLTLSDTRTPATDAGGAIIRARLEPQGHSIAHYEVLRDDAPLLEAALDRLLERDEIDLIITTGGTGLSSRDNAADVVTRRIEKPIDGFGEIFRALSFEAIGPAALLSRAVAGLANRKAIVALPGSAHAVELAMDRLIIPVLPHLLRELRR